MKRATWHPYLAVGFFGAVVAMLLAPWALAEVGPLVDEVEREGIDLLYAALAAAVTAVAGWFVKRPQDYMRERKSRQNGSGGASGGNGDHSTAKLALDAIRAHELACREREERERERQDKQAAEWREEIRRLHGRIDTLTKETAELNGNVQRLFGRLEGKDAA